MESLAPFTFLFSFVILLELMSVAVFLLVMREEANKYTQV
jgi:hypothetical protein